MNEQVVLDRLLTLQRGWGGQDEEPIAPAIVAEARKLLALLPADWPKPWVGPTFAGGVILEWFDTREYLIEYLSIDTCGWYILDKAARWDAEGQCSAEPETLLALLRLFRDERFRVGEEP